MKTTNNNNIETLMGATLVWPSASNLQGEYLLESYTRATKGKAEVWLHDKASGHIITMDLSRRTLGDLQQTGEHRTDAGTTIRIKQDAGRPLWISVNNGVAGDIFKEWGEAVSDLQRHVYNTLQGCCGCEIHRESATRYQAYFEDDDKWEVSEVVPFDPTNSDHREAYEAQRDRLGLPELPAIRQAEGVKVGDRVKVKSQDTPADVTAISEDGQYFTVKFVYPVREFWTGDTMQTATYSRYGITRNYDRMTGEEIVGNAQYYTEQLKYGPASIIEYELAGVALRTESTREDVEPDSREGWGNEYRVTIHHQTGDTTETMTLSETAELLARMYQEEQGKAA